ncbi:hypothetical protein GCM10010219_09430 [Streptomyces netropsis]|nr:hypothetical protein GCM10010219_09430 [Streptomyces netropsis]
MIVRRSLYNELALAVVVDQAEVVADSVAPLQLYLERVGELVVEVHDSGEHRYRQVLRLLVVQQLHPGWPVETTVGALLWPGLDRKWSGTWSEHPDTERTGVGEVVRQREVEAPLAGSGPRVRARPGERGKRWGRRRGGRPPRSRRG